MLINAYSAFKILDLTFVSLAGVIFPKYLSYLVWGLFKLVSRIRLWIIANNWVSGLYEHATVTYNFACLMFAFAPVLSVSKLWTT